MHQQGGTIKRAMDKIAKNDYVLPAIQREFVWKPEQICMLFDSVMQGYPFGQLLLWSIEAENSGNYRYYGFVRDYHQRDNPHCPELGQLPARQITAVLDGQQRLTAFNIGLRGSMAVKLPYKWWTNPDAFPHRVLALDVLAESDRDEDGSMYRFRFIEERLLCEQEKNEDVDGTLWFRVPRILSINEGSGILNWILKYDLTKEQQSHAFSVLNRFYTVIHQSPTIAYWEEDNQDIEHVLDIFIRTNSGGTKLSYSDLLLSIATSQWTKRDARKEVHKLVDELNGIGPGLGLSKDFVLKAGLMLSDIASVGFQVRNFTAANMATLEENWHKIRAALIETVQVVTGFGFDARSIRAVSALLPIAYYLYKIDSPRDFDSGVRYAGERKRIHSWLTRSILKASGIWGSALDTFLTALRKTIREADTNFPAEQLRRTMARQGKTLDFSEEEIDDLASIGFNDSRVFSMLALLAPFVDLKHNKFHIDHVFPKSRFTPSRLRRALKNARVPKNRIEEEFNQFRDCSNRIANLQLLEGSVNMSKRAQLPKTWIKKAFPEESSRRQYCENHMLGEIPEDIAGFLTFYKERRVRLRAEISRLVNSA